MLGFPNKQVVQAWQKPAVESYKINIDGSYKDGKEGIGLLVRDHVGDIIAAA